ncbi:MAG: hypothetical protein GY710_02175 [Desulfobacteraceae bacterium]|nr:hypothetical protein [Desulfobacteraceae bacterium]
MTIDEQRKLVEAITVRAERMYISKGKEVIDSHIMRQLSGEIGKLNKMERGE